MPKDHKVGSLVVFYNLMVYDSKSRSELAAVALGKARSHGGRSIRNWARVFEETQESSSLQRRAHSKMFSLLSLPEVAHAMRAYLRSNKWSMTPTLLAQYSAEQWPQQRPKYTQERSRSRKCQRGYPNTSQKKSSQGLGRRFKEASTSH
jgi:hypothetical protein